MANLSSQEALTRLKEGNGRFVIEQNTFPRNDKGRRSELTGGQNPYAIVLSCADSRVAPELAFDEGLGDLFVVRVAGNVANTSSIASIEYAVAHLDVNLIVVMGHESCGAVGAAMGGGDNGYNLNHLLSHIAPALAKAEGAETNEVVKTNAQLNAGELQSRSGIISGAVESGKVQIVSAYYNLGDGKVDFL